MIRLAVIGVFLTLSLFNPLEAAAQRRAFGFDFGGRGRENDLSVLWGIPDVRSGFHVCRLMYTRVRDDPSGSGWTIEYPRAEINFMTRIGQLTTTKIARWKDGSPGYTVVRATDRELFSCPWVVMASAGTAGFSDAEAYALREFLQKGGFLWADDFWGDASWNHWIGELSRVLPEYEIVQLTPGMAAKEGDKRGAGIFDVLYVIPEVPQIPSLNRWRQGMSASEFPGAEYATPTMHGIFDEGGRLMVLMTHNTDIADGWEREADLPSYFEYFAARAYAVGVNVALWVMTR
jgi:hypothetical protein